MKGVQTGGGWPAVNYALGKAREAGGLWKLYKAMRSKNACKSCALGMGGQKGGMVNEKGHYPEVCKKSIQAMVADMQEAIYSQFWKTYGLAELQALTPRELESCGRLVQPMLFRRGEKHYTPIAWNDALNCIIEKLKTIQADETFWYVSGRSSIEAGFLLQLFARMYGTNNINNVSYYCHQASGVGLTSVTGSGTATVVLEDVEHADVVFVMGGNPASNHPRLMRMLLAVRRRGGHVVVINPVIETGLVNFSLPSDLRSLLLGSKIASIYVQPDIGGDLALLTGVAKRIHELGAIDKRFLQENCNSWPALSERLRTMPWNEIYAKSGVSEDEINRLATIYASSKNTIFCWTMGITQHAHGVQNVQAIANLALMRGMVGRPHAGLLPIRGHSNVQGMGSVGVTPRLKEAIFERVEAHFGTRLPTQDGLDTLACIEGAAESRLKFGFCLGGNLFGSSPDAKFTREALSNMEMLVSLNTTLNTGHANALAAETLILPVLARDEEPQATTQESMFNYVRLSNGGPRRHEGPRSEVEVISSIASAVPGDWGRVIDWKAMEDTGNVRKAIAKVVPGFEKLGEMERTKEEFQVDGRTFHTPRFSTPNGRANLHIHNLPKLKGGDAALRLMTVRSEGQFNTVIYEDDDLYRGVVGRDVVLINTIDINRLGLHAGQRVMIQSETNSLADIRVIAFDQIKPGNVLMYYPEANILVGRQTDPDSKTPGFKCNEVTIKFSAPA